MKKTATIITKIGIGFITNLFVLLSVVLNIWEFFKSLTARIVTKLPLLFTAFVSIVSFLTLIAFIFSPDMFNSNGMKIFCCVILIVAASILIRLSDLIMGLVSALLLIVIELFNTVPIIGFMRDSFMKLVDKYLNYCNSDIKTIERLYIFGICYILNFLKNLFKTISVVFSIAIYPIFTVCAGIFGYWFVFIDSAAPTTGTLEWYISMAFVVVFAVIGICLAYVFNESVKEGIEDSDFDLFYIFEIYSNTYKNYSNKKYQGNRKNINQEENSKENQYFAMFSDAKSYDEVKKIYRKLSKEVHPDVSDLPEKEACMRMAELNNAYEYYENKFREVHI